MALTDSLISFWELEEASGSRSDAHGSNDLTENGGTISGVAGKVGNAADLESSSSNYFSHADNADLSTGDVDFSIQVWAYPESVGGFPVIVAKGWQSSGPDREYAIFYGSFLQFLVQGPSSSGGVTSTIGLTAGVWHQILAWHDSVNNIIGIQVNQETPVTTAWTEGLADTTRPFWLGASPDQGLYFDGLIDQVGFWKRVLTSAERTQLYNGGNGLSYAAMSAQPPSTFNALLITP